MKFPIFVLPNKENRSDVHMLDAEGGSLTATEFSAAIGKITTLRLMVNEESARLQKPWITAQTTTTWGKLFCFAYPFDRDSNNRITTCAIVFRENDVEALNSDSALGKLADRVGINATLRGSISREVEAFKMDELLREKKKR